jgi:hypothetical protein
MLSLVEEACLAFLRSLAALGEAERLPAMSNLGLAILTFTVIAAVMLATRPISFSSRRHKDEETESNREVEPPPAPSAILARRSPPLPFLRIHRNRWDRDDLARGVGGHQQDPDPTYSLWPQA